VELPTSPPVLWPRSIVEFASAPRCPRLQVGRRRHVVESQYQPSAGSTSKQLGLSVPSVLIGRRGIRYQPSISNSAHRQVEPAICRACASSITSHCVVSPCVMHARMMRPPQNFATKPQPCPEATKGLTIDRASRERGGGSMHSTATGDAFATRQPCARSSSFSNRASPPDRSTCSP